MSSLSRHTLRTTAAVTGVAVLGTGLAGNALAVTPDPEASAAVPQPAAGLPAPAAVSRLADLSSASEAPSLPALPMLFVFEGPTINTSAPSGPAGLDVPGMPGVPGLDRIALPVAAATDDAPSVRTPAPWDDHRHTQAATEAVSRADVDPDDEAGPPQGPATGQVGALSQLDSAGLFDGVVRQTPYGLPGLQLGGIG